MYPFVAIHLSATPTDEELRKAREVLALMRSFGVAGEQAKTATVDDAARAFNPPPPTAAAPAAATHADSVVPVDSSGLPWDERIHSGAKSQNQDGSWKKRKGVQESEVTRVTAEIRAALATGASQPNAAPIVPPPPAAAVVPPPPPATPAGGVSTFADLMAKVGKLQQAQKLTQAELTTCIANSGMPADAKGQHNAIGIATNPSFIPAINALIDATVAGR